MNTGNRSFRFCYLALSLLIANLNSGQSFAIQYHLTDLAGSFSDGQKSYYPLDINNAGQIVGLSSFGNNINRAFVWTSTDGIQELPQLSGAQNQSDAFSINDTGIIVGASLNTNGNAFTPVRWTGSGSPEYLGSLGGLIGGSQVAGRGRAINSAGHIAGHSESLTGTHAFLWREGIGMQNLGDLPGGEDYSYAYAMNENDIVVGGSATTNGHQAFIWSAADGMRQLTGLPDGVIRSVGNAVNNAGQVLVEAAIDAGPRSFLWTEGVGMQDIGHLSGGFEITQAVGMNSYGQVVGSSSITTDPNDHWRAIIWSASTGMQNLNDLLDSSSNGWTILGANDINDVGQIVGLAVNPEGAYRGYLLTPVPEPNTLWSSILVGILCGVAARKRFRVNYLP
jgi:probable HAF family extracellular repeat protein